MSRKAKPLFVVFSLLFRLFVSGHQIFSESSNCGENDEQVVTRSMFPDDFLFGTATSAYQIEGAYLDDGKSLTNWDVFTRVPGNVKNGDNADIADDHFHRYMDDIENLHFLGVNAYRFSISWARILPMGRFGEVNPKGVEFYNKLIDNLLLRGIEPFVTIHHNDIPQELEDRYGSWLSPLIQEDFVRFANTCFEKFGDRVKYWMTINEPDLYTILTYLTGQFPPRRCSPPFGNCSTGNSDLEPLVAVHNMLLSHAKAVKLYRQHYQAKQSGMIGITIHSFNYEPYRDDEFSLQAVKRAFAYNVGWILDPLIYGDYPSIMRKYIGNNLPNFSKEEEEIVKGSVDFIGINHYSSLYAIDCFHYPIDCIAGENRAIRGFTGVTGYRDGIPIGDKMGLGRYFVVPYGMEKVTDYIREKYPNITIYVTENGYAPPEQDSLLDFKRVRYHEAYLAALVKAMRKGAKVKGYFAWSLMDSFEWVNGYNVSFGLYYVDRETLQRTPKLSVKWYADFIASKVENFDGKSTPKSFVLANHIAPTCCNVRRADK